MEPIFSLQLQKDLEKERTWTLLTGLKKHASKIIWLKWSKVELWDCVAKQANYSREGSIQRKGMIKDAISIRQAWGASV